MELAEAQKYAGAIVEWLGPYCHVIEIAGSVRRRRPVCGDIDIVCIPKLVPAPRDLLGNADGVPKSLLREFLMSYVWSEPRASWRSGEEPKADAVNFLLKLPKCELDVFAANEASFASVWICRTGSKEHNIWLAERAHANGYKWELRKGLMRIDGTQERTASEEEFFKVLGLAWVKPEDREKSN
jgi:DNA polymerase/3'-5' exonuclease PolX